MLYFKLKSVNKTSLLLYEKAPKICIYNKLKYIYCHYIYEKWKFCNKGLKVIAIFKNLNVTLQYFKFHHKNNFMRCTLKIHKLINNAFIK